MNYKFGSYTSAYAHPKEFRRMCSSLCDKVDVMICHFGRYTGYDTNDELNDEAFEVVQIAAEYEMDVIAAPPMTELQKRSQAPLIAKQREIDFLLIIDSDEFIDLQQSDWDKFKENCIKWAIDIHHGMYNIFGVYVEDGPQNYRALPRLWYKPEEIYYDKKHWAIKTSNPLCPMVRQQALKHEIKEIIDGLVIRSNTDLRSQKSQEFRRSYVALE